MGTYSLHSIHEVLKETNFFTDRIKYAFLQLNKSDYSQLLQDLSKYSSEYVEIIHDKDELSVIIPKEVWEADFGRYQVLQSMGDIALITCKVKQKTVTGFLLALVSVLSPNNISVFVQGAYTTDHIFVPYEQLDKALQLLNQLKQ